MLASLDYLTKYFSIFEQRINQCSLLIVIERRSSHVIGGGRTFVASLLDSSRTAPPIGLGK